MLIGLIFTRALLEWLGAHVGDRIGEGTEHGNREGEGYPETRLSRYDRTPIRQLFLWTMIPILIWRTRAIRDSDVLYRWIRRQFGKIEEHFFVREFLHCSFIPFFLSSFLSSVIPSFRLLFLSSVIPFVCYSACYSVCYFCYSNG